MDLIHTIVSHKNIHFDEQLGIYLFDRFAPNFIGIQKAVFLFDGEGGTNYKGRPACEWEEQGYVLIGAGASDLDEHKGPDSEGKEGECASSLVAKFLGVQEDPTLERLLRLAMQNDTKGVTHPFDICDSLDALYFENPDGKEKEIIQIIVRLIGAHQKRQAGFIKAEQEELKGAEIHDIHGPGGKSLKLYVLRSDNRLISKAARRNGADIVLQVQPSGQMQIYTSNKSQLNISQLVGLLRYEEQLAKGCLIEGNWDVLCSKGKIGAVLEWFYQGGEMALNGSLSCPDVPPTKLTVEKVVELIITSMDDDMINLYLSENAR